MASYTFATNPTCVAKPAFTALLEEKVAAYEADLFSASYRHDINWGIVKTDDLAKEMLKSAKEELSNSESEVLSNSDPASLPDLSWTDLTWNSVGQICICDGDFEAVQTAIMFGTDADKERYLHAKYACEYAIEEGLRKTVEAKLQEANSHDRGSAFHLDGVNQEFEVTPAEEDHDFDDDLAEAIAVADAELAALDLAA